MHPHSFGPLRSVVFFAVTIAEANAKYLKSLPSAGFCARGALTPRGTAEDAS